jgi:hypothetical protein
MGQEFDDLLNAMAKEKIEEPNPMARWSQKKITGQAVEQMKQIYADPAFMANPIAAFGVTAVHLDAKMADFASKQSEKQ